MRRISHQIDRKAIRRAFEHAKGFTKHKITHDIENQPVTPICYIPWLPPPLLVSLDSAAPDFLLKNPTCRSHIRQNVPLQALDRSIAERVAHDPALPRVLHLVNAAVYIVRVLVCRERRVEIGFADVGSEAIDGLQGRRRVDGERVGPNAHIRSVLLVSAVEGEMSAAAVGVVG